MTDHPPLRPRRRLRRDAADAGVRAGGVHVNYAEAVLPMRDGLPKLKDFPTEFGGSGEMITE